jgi:hypothetical protein
MNPAKSLKRIRWAVRGALLLGVAASVTANVLHAVDNPISQVIAAWPPLALLLTIELIARVPVHSRGLALARFIAAAVITGIAAWVSYWHMAGVADRYGETEAGAAYMLPISVDGLIVVASICLVELAGRIRADEGNSTWKPDNHPYNDSAASTPGSSSRSSSPPSSSPSSSGPPGVSSSGSSATEPVEKVATPRKSHPSSAERVARAHKRHPDASHKELAERLNLSTRTVREHRPKPDAGTPVNGHHVMQDR